MEAGARHIHSGEHYDHLFPKADLKDSTVKRGATVEDTVRFIPKVVQDTLWQTEKIARKLKAETVRKTCRNIWHFVYDHIAYHKDEEGLEQIRSPARAWHDRKKGVDCDCYTVFISSILCNLKIPHLLRITKYKKDRFQHIYPVVTPGDGSEITVDCVVNDFGYEEPYSEKKDTNMDLQYLSGLEETAKTVDQMDLTGDDDLGKFNLKEKLKKGLFITNRINPATVTLRNGLLAAMKLNIFKLGGMLKWSYLSEADAKKRGVNMDNWRKLVKIREKMENIFYTAGGKPENLKKAILNGKGNRNHEVSGLDAPDPALFKMDENSPIEGVLGDELFHDENVNGIEGLSGLGEPFTAASIASATGVLGAIAALIKNIGAVFPKHDKASEDFKADAKTDTSTSDTTTHEEDHAAPDESEKKNKLIKKTHSGGDDTKAPASNENVQPPPQDDNSGGDKPQGFWAKNKKWLKPTLFGAGGLAVLFGGYEAYKHHKKKTEAEAEKKPLSGVKQKKKAPKKKSVKLL